MRISAGGDGVELGGVVEAIFEDGEAGEDFARVEDDLAHLEQHVFHLRRRGRVKGLGGRDLAHADDHHLGEAALDGAGEAGVELDAIEDQHAGRFEGVAVHPDGVVAKAPLETVPSFTTSIEARIGMPIACFGHAERFDHRPLAFGGAAVVAAHRGKQEGPSAVSAEPIAGGFGDRGDIGDAAAAGGDADVALRHFELEAVERSVDGGRDVGDGVGDELLMDAEELHGAVHYSRRTVSPRLAPESAVRMDLLASRARD